MTSPTQLSLKYLRDLGYMAEVVEKTIPHTFIKKDLFGFIDIIAIKPGTTGVLGVQCTSDGARKAHTDKQKTLSKELDIWTNCGNRLVMHCWGKKKYKLKSGIWSNASKWRMIEVEF